MGQSTSSNANIVTLVNTLISTQKNAITVQHLKDLTLQIQEEIARDFDILPDYVTDIISILSLLFMVGVIFSHTGLRYLVNENTTRVKELKADQSSELREIRHTASRNSRRVLPAVHEDCM